MTTGHDDPRPSGTPEEKALQHGLISGLWMSAYFAEAMYYLAAVVTDGFIPVVLFVFGQIALIAAILGTVIYAWTMPHWNRAVMGWMWAGCILAGLWLGMYYAPLALVVWSLALITTIRWLPTLRRTSDAAPQRVDY